PIVFCASFMPCDRPMAAAEATCALPKNALTNGVRPSRLSMLGRPEHHHNPKYSRIISANVITNPAIGVATIGIITLGNTPPANHQCCAPSAHQMTASKLLSLPARAAPTKPPTKPWLELDGNPHHHVTKFQIMAPSNAL